MDDQQQCLEPLLQITGSINILPVDFVIDTRSINTLSLLKKSSELRTKNVLEYLATRPNTSSKISYELKPIIRIVHTTSMHKSLMTSFTIHPLPTNNSVDNNEPVVDNQYPFRKFVNLPNKV